ncbi:hypothetical protein B0T14DRAFT_548929 [Immersiella caudata]|uniref:VWFA domain-containing protein n=1 Tax=Immersiella caudata TaxID=314043 RepID=A0AA39TYP2_9PEZI|nr:hypothetical protein B0T14DRAFT_548929 [Immersiella caudata]
MQSPQQHPQLDRVLPQGPRVPCPRRQDHGERRVPGRNHLAEHDDPQFDVYFIHGLGGHAYRSWSNDRDLPFPQMWPKDFFPNDVGSRPVNPKDPSGPKLAGRFSTVGYRASALDTWSATTTIKKAAENLINTIQTNRPVRSTRPMYFVCHSLGGLVTCQALLYALRPNEDGLSAERQAAYRNVFFQDGQCLVKGIFFFGTPFEVSKLANYASRIVKFLKGNTALVDSLQVKSSDLTAIVTKFNQLRSGAETKIPLIIAFESLPMYGVKFVTEPESAMGSFNLQTIGVDGDHRTMIKFPHNQDKSYREVSELMIRAIQATLSGSATTAYTVSSLPPYPGSSHPSSPPSSSSSSSYSSPPMQEEPTLPPSLPRISQSFPVRPRVPEERPLSSNPFLSDLRSNNPYSNTTAAPTPIQFSSLALSQSDQQHQEQRREDRNEFALLSQFDTVFLLDDTASMTEPIISHPNTDDQGTEKTPQQTKWDQLVESLQYTVSAVCRYDANGVDVFFMCNDSKHETNITDGQRIIDLLTREVTPDETGGGTFISSQLHTILAMYMGRYTNWKGYVQRLMEKPEMLNLIVITDGEANDKESVEDVIVSTARELDEMHAHPTQVGIQFLQIGTDENAARWLAELDNSLKARHGIRDMVDTRPWDSPREMGRPLRERIAQILLGAISSAKDRESPGQPRHHT